MKVILATHPYLVEGRPTPYIPLGLLLLLSLAKRDRFDAHISIMDINRVSKTGSIVDSAADTILASGADVVGLSTNCSSYLMTLRLAERIKKSNKNIITVLGGPQASATAPDTLKSFSKAVDFILAYECENVFLPFLRAISGNRDFSTVNNLYYLHNDRARIHASEPLINSLDALPFIHLEDIPNIEHFDIIPVETGRGCPCACSFCSTSSFWRRQTRMFSPERVVEQIKYYYKHGYRTFELYHDNFTANRHWVDTFCRELKNSGMSEIKWTGSSRLDFLTEDMIQKMSDTGFNKIYLGIETGSREIQKHIGKNLALSDLEEKLAVLKKYGIGSTVSFILGFPTEERTHLLDTLNAILQLLCSNQMVDVIQIHTLAPLSGSSLISEYKDRIFLPNRFRMASFCLEAPTEDRAFLERNKNIFPNFFVYPHRVLGFEDLFSLSVFASQWAKFPHTMFLLWQDDGFDFPEILVDEPSLLRYFSDLDWSNTLQEILAATRKTLLELAMRSSQPRLINEILAFEVATLATSIYRFSSDCPITLLSPFDVQSYINKIHHGDRWVVPEADDDLKVAYVFWREKDMTKSLSLPPPFSNVMKTSAVLENPFL